MPGKLYQSSLAYSIREKVFPKQLRIKIKEWEDRGPFGSEHVVKVLSGSLIPDIEQNLPCGSVSVGFCPSSSLSSRPVFWITSSEILLR